jgi:hypothetical protein
VASFGSDTLILCSRESPHLLILSDDLPDISCADVINSLRRRAEYKGLRILCCARSASREDCLQWGADHFLSVEGMEPRNIQREVYRLLGIAKEEPTEETGVEHKRRWPRIPVKIPARIGLFRVSAPRKHSWGQAVVRNISQGGAYLTDILFDEKVIPGEAFRLVLDIAQAPLEGWRAHCQVVRLHSNGSLTAGVRFARISKTDRDRIAELAVG